VIAAFASFAGAALAAGSALAPTAYDARSRLENIFHRLFGAAQLDLTIEDRFGHPVKPREWFLVPLHVIDEAVQRIRDGSITNVVYDPATAVDQIKVVTTLLIKLSTRAPAAPTLD
jgi:hypothetical protein